MYHVYSPHRLRSIPVVLVVMIMLLQGSRVISQAKRPVKQKVIGENANRLISEDQSHEETSESQMTTEEGLLLIPVTTVTQDGNNGGYSVLNSGDSNPSIWSHSRSPSSSPYHPKPKKGGDEASSLNEYSFKVRIM